jgi:hypothetical protein
MKSGEERLRATLRRTRSQKPRTTDPVPYDDDWGWWMHDRLSRIEEQIKKLLWLGVGIFAAEVLRIALAALGIV